MKEYENLITGPLAAFLAASGKIGGLVKEQVSSPTPSLRLICRHCFSLNFIFATELTPYCLMNYVPS